MGRWVLFNFCGDHLFKNETVDVKFVDLKF